MSVYTSVLSEKQYVYSKTESTLTYCLEQSETLLIKMEKTSKNFKEKERVDIKLNKTEGTETTTRLKSSKNSRIFQCRVLLQRVDIDCKYKKAKFVSNDTHSETQQITNSAETKKLFNKQQATLQILLEAEVSNDAESGLCQFDCLECHKSYCNWAKLAMHVKSQHENKSIHMKNFQDYLYKATVHICQICKERVLCDSKFLSQHFRYKHDTSVDEYRQQFKCDSSLKKDLQSSLKRGRFSQDEIGNLCTYRCKGCNNVYRGSQNFQLHARSKSANCPLKDDTPQWQTSLEEIVKHKCKLCFKILFCDSRSISRHAYYTHGFKSIEEYAKKTGCTLRKKSFGINSIENEALVNSAPIFKEIGNYCSFTCDKCGHKSSQWFNMRRHLKTTHEYISKGTDWQKFISRPVLHKCNICQEKILNDLEFIKTHLKKKHKQSCTKYKDSYTKHT